MRMKKSVMKKRMSSSACYTHQHSARWIVVMLFVSTLMMTFAIRGCDAKRGRTI